MPSQIDELERLTALMEKGALTPAEFKQQKQALLGAAQTSPNSTGPLTEETEEPAKRSLDQWLSLKPLTNSEDAQHLANAAYAVAIVVILQGGILGGQSNDPNATETIRGVMTALLAAGGLWLARMTAKSHVWGTAVALTALATTQFIALVSWQLTHGRFHLGIVILGASGAFLGIQAIRGVNAWNRIAEARPESS